MLLLLVSLLCSRSARAWGGGGGAKHDRIHEVAQLEQQWRHAELAGDTTALDRILSDDYVSVTMQGKVNTKAQQLRRIRDRLLVLNELDLSGVKIRVSGEIAVVTGHARVLGRSAGLSLDGRYRYTQVLHLLPNGAWTITNFEAQRVGTNPQPLLAMQRTAHTG